MDTLGRINELTLQQCRKCTSWIDEKCTHPDAADTLAFPGCSLWTPRVEGTQRFDEDKSTWRQIDWGKIYGVRK